jgi:hypothetical protein
VGAWYYPGTRTALGERRQCAKSLLRRWAVKGSNLRP